MMPLNNNNRNSSGGGFGNFMLPFIGGAAIGAAGAATYDHFAHQNNDNYDNYNVGDDANAATDDPADYGDMGGGDDYGGDFGF